MTPLIALAGLAITLWACRRFCDDPQTRTILTASYAVKAALTVLLFYLSCSNHPVLAAYRIGGGLWTFAWDSAVYHSLGKQIADAWRAGTPLPVLGPEWPQDFHTALIYFLFGAVPLHAALFNAWYGTVAGICAYRIIRTFSSGENARAGTFLIAFWPSLILWSTQILKEPLVIGLLLFAIWLPVERGKRPLRYAAAAAAILLIALLREYVAVCLVSGGLIAAAGSTVARRNPKTFAAVACACFALIAGTWLLGMRSVFYEMTASWQGGAAGLLFHRLPEYLTAAPLHQKRYSMPDVSTRIDQATQHVDTRAGESDAR